MKIFKVIGLIVATLIGASAIAAEEVTYYHTNLHGSPVAATDNAGAILWERSYDPWGHPTSSASVSPLGYTGAPREGATNLTDLKARWYSPVSGRMQSLDPVSFHEENIHSFNLYAYGNNNPYRYEDPDGEVAIGFLTETVPAAGESYAALAAYTVGYFRGDAILMQVALDGMHERRSENISAVLAPFAPKTLRNIKATKGTKPSISEQKQAGHIPGTPQNANRLKQGKLTSSFFGKNSGERLTQKAFEKGKPVPGRPTVREHDFGISTGTGPNGGMQTRVRVHQDSKGRIHGHPSGPERL